MSSIVLLCSAALNEDEFRQLEEQVLEIESGAILVISGSLPPGVKLEKLTQLISAAQNQGIRCIIDSSGEALVQHWRLVTSSWLSVTKKNSVRW